MRAISLTISSAALVCGVATVVILFLPRDRTFYVSAVTEATSIVVHDTRGVAARLPVARIASRPDELFRLSSLEAADGIRLTLARKRDGDLLVGVEWGGTIKDGARLVTRDGSPVALSSGESLWVSLERPSPYDASVKIPDTVTLGFQGELDIGYDVARFVDRTLLSGRVLVVERQPVSRKRYVVAEATLDPGDVAVLRTRSGRSPAVAGFVHAGSGPALQVTAYAAADHVQVDRFGAARYEIEPSAWDRIGRDPVVTGLGIVLGAFVALLTIYDLGVRRVRTKSDAEHDD